MKKKTVIILSCFILFLIVGLSVVLPYVFRHQIRQSVLRYLSEHVEATVDCSDISLSFFSNFPQASIVVDDVLVQSSSLDFSNDTIIFSEQLLATIDLRSLFSKKYQVKEILFDNPKVFLQQNKQGKQNWNVFKTTSETTDTASVDFSTFSFALSLFEINDGKIFFFNEQSEIFVDAQEVNFELSGDFSVGKTDMNLRLKAEDFDVIIAQNKYVSRSNIAIKAEIEADLEAMDFKLKDNQLRLNEVLLSFDGNVIKSEVSDDYYVDLKLKAPHTEFKQILSLVPSLYHQSFKDIDADGEVALSSSISGVLGDDEIPSFELNLDIQKAKLKYRSLPKSIENISIQGNIFNNGDSWKKTKVRVDQFSFQMAENTFSGSFSVSDFTDNMDLNLNAKGSIDLSAIKDFYPLPKDKVFSGIVAMNIVAQGKMSDFQQKKYEKICLNGNATIKNLLIEAKELKHDLAVKEAELLFSNEYVDLTNFQAKLGRSDLQAFGHLDNFIPYVFRGDNLMGQLSFSSTNLFVEDFIVENEKEQHSVAKDTIESEIVILPKNFDFKLQAQIKNLFYDKITINDLSGEVQLMDSKLQFHQIDFLSMGGRATMSGQYNTEDEKRPFFRANMTIADVHFKEVYKQIESAKELLPIFQKTTGRFSAQCSLFAPLSKDMSPILNEVEAKGFLSSENLTISGVKALHTLSNVLKRTELYDPEITSVTVPFYIKNGCVKTEAFDFMVADTKVAVEQGLTTLDETIDYTMRVDIPTESTTIFKLNKLSVAMTGTFSEPKVKIQTKELFKDAGQTMKSNIQKTFSEVGKDMKEQWSDAKEEFNESMKEAREESGSELKEAGREIKETFRGLFSRNKKSSSSDTSDAEDLEYE